MHIVAKPDICKQLCEYQGYQLKIEVNQAKRGIIGGDVVRMPVCNKTQEDFGLYCETDIVPMASYSILYPSFCQCQTACFGWGSGTGKLVRAFYRRDRSDSVLDFIRSKQI